MKKKKHRRRIKEKSLVSLVVDLVSTIAAIGGWPVRKLAGWIHGFVDHHPESFHGAQGGLRNTQGRGGLPDLGIDRLIIQACMKTIDECQWWLLSVHVIA